MSWRRLEPSSRRLPTDLLPSVRLATSSRLSNPEVESPTRPRRGACRRGSYCGVVKQASVCCRGDRLADRPGRCCAITIGTLMRDPDYPQRGESVVGVTRRSRSTPRRCSGHTLRTRALLGEHEQMTDEGPDAAQNQPVDPTEQWRWNDGTQWVADTPPPPTPPTWTPPPPPPTRRRGRHHHRHRRGIVGFRGRHGLRRPPWRSSLAYRYR